jgi:hypothetical protein
LNHRENIDRIAPDLSELVDLCRRLFDASLVHLKYEDQEAGNAGIYAEPGCLWTFYQKPKVRR